MCFSRCLIYLIKHYVCVKVRESERKRTRERKRKRKRKRKMEIGMVGVIPAAGHR